MIKYLKYFLIAAFLFSGCTAERIAVKKPKERQQLSEQEKKALALSHFINGTLLDVKDEYEAAITEYKWASALDPKAGIYYCIAKDSYIIGKYDEALVNINKAVKKDSINEAYSDMLGDILIANNKKDSAITVYEYWIARDSASLNANYKLAKLIESAKPQDAIKIYKKIIDNNGPIWDVLVRLAELYEKSNNLKEAINVAEKMREIYPSELSINKVLIELLEKNNDFEKAMSLTNDLIELTPNDLILRETKANLYIDLNDWVKASEEFNYILNSKEVGSQDKIKIGAAYFTHSLKDTLLLPVSKEIFTKLDKDTTAWEVKMFLGSIAVDQKNYAEAYKNYKSVTELASWNLDGWNRLGGLYYENQKYSEAVSVLQEAIKIFPEEYSINFLLGISLAQSSRYSEAKPYLYKSVQMNEKDVNTLSAYAYTLNSLKESEEAINYFNLALQINKNDANILGTLGLIYNGMKRYTECDSVYQRALTIDSTNALINNNFAYSLSERGIELEKALRMIKIALKAEPSNSSYLDTEGWIYYRLGEYEKAEKQISKAIELSGAKSTLYDHLGDIYYKLGQKSKAVEMWQKAYDLDKNNNEIKLKIDKGEL